MSLCFLLTAFCLLALRQLRHDLVHRSTAFFDFFRLERHRTYHGMATATIAFADLRDIVSARAW